MALSPESPAGAPPPKSAVGAFVVGLVLGLIAGGTVLMLISFAAIAGLSALLFPHSQNNSAWLQFLGVIPALALGWWAIVRLRQGANFFTGALIGLSAGMLGGVTLCSILYSGFSTT